MSRASRTPTARQRIGAVMRSAATVKELIDAHDLAIDLDGRLHVKAEAWQLIALSQDATLVTERVDPTSDGWRASAVVHDSRGRLLGRGETVTTRRETFWSRADDHALMSMAQTRAQGRAGRAVWGFVVKLAGFEPTPAEEMPGAWRAALPGWATSASADDLRAATTRALTAAGVPAGIVPEHGRTLLTLVKGETGGALPAVAVAVLEALAAVVGGMQTADAPADRLAEVPARAPPTAGPYETEG